MKIYKFLLYALLAWPALMLQSCLKDQEDLFDESASQRIERYLSDAEKTLISSEHGWAFDFYPGTHQEYGGFSFAVKFHGDSATVAGFPIDDSYKAGKTITTLYQMKKDAGAVLSFDTYNAFIHFFSDPYKERPEAYQGDFEFVIDSIAPDLVKVHGKRNQTTMYFRKLTKPVDQYLKDADKMLNSFDLEQALGNINGKIVSVKFNGSTAIIAEGSTTQSAAFAFTDEGIRFHEPVSIGGKEVSTMKYDAAAKSLTATHDNAIVFNNFKSVYDLNDKTFTTVLTVSGLQGATVSGSNASWLHVSANGEQLQIAADANDTKHLRRGVVTLSLAGGSTQEITLTQCEFAKDIAGTYTLTYVNAKETKIETKAIVETDITTKKPRIVMIGKIGKTDVPYAFPATWDEKTYTLSITSGSYLGNIPMTATTTYYLYPIFYNVATTVSSNWQKDIVAKFPFEYSESENLTKATITGELGSFSIGQIRIYAMGSKQFHMNNSKGSIDVLIQPTLTK